MLEQNGLKNFNILDSPPARFESSRFADSLRQQFVDDLQAEKKHVEQLRHHQQKIDQGLVEKNAVLLNMPDGLPAGAEEASLAKFRNFAQ